MRSHVQARILTGASLAVNAELLAYSYLEHDPDVTLYTFLVGLVLGVGWTRMGMERVVQTEVDLTLKTIKARQLSLGGALAFHGCTALAITLIMHGVNMVMPAPSLRTFMSFAVAISGGRQVGEVAVRMAEALYRRYSLSL